MSLTSPQIAKLRDGHPHKSRFYMTVIIPTQVYCGTVTGNPAKGARSITLVDVSGNIANLVDGMTLYVGTSAGDNSISKRRYRTRAGNVITLDENAITWVNGQYVTAYKNWEFWPIYPYITPSTPYTFYKDYDIAYSSQNTNIPPVAIAGGPFVGFLDGVSKVFNLDATKSYPMAAGSSTLTYLWACDGGSIANSTNATTTITFTSAGQYWLSLTVSDAHTSTSQILHTPIVVHNRNTSNLPITDFTITNDLAGDWKGGGYDMGVDMWDKTVIDNIIDGAYCILWKESYYNGVEGYLGNNANIQFAGYIIGETIVRSPKAGNVTFTVATINSLMDKKEMPSISIEESNETATWYRFPVHTLTVARCIHHYWKWHSTLFSIADVFLPVGLTDTLLACDDFEQGQMYAIVDAFTYQYSVFAKVCSDAAGRLYVEQDINMLSDANRAGKDVMMSLTSTDRREETDVTFTRNDQKVSCVQVSGTYLDGSTYKPLFSSCPGEMYSDMGVNLANYERLVLHDQAMANFLSGRLFSVANQDVLEVTMVLSGDYPVELVPQVWWTLTNMDTKRADINLEGVKAVVRHVAYKIDVISGIVYPEITFEPEAPNILGDGVTIPPPVDPTTATGGTTTNPFIPPPLNPVSLTTIGRFGWSFIIGNSMSIIPTGVIGMIEVPYNCIIDSAELVTQPGITGSIIIDIWRCTYAQISPGTHPVDADSITAAAPPTLVSAYKSVSPLTGWTTQLYKGDWIFLNVDSVASLTLVTLAISGVAQQ